MKPSAIVRLVAMREIRERTRSRVFIISTLIGAAIVCALIILPKINEGEVKTYDVALVNVTDPVIRAAAQNAGVVANAKVATKDYTDIKKVRAGVRDGSIDIALVDARTIIVGDPPPEGRITTKSRLIAAISESARLQTALTDAGLSSVQAASALSAEPLPVEALGKPNQPSQEQFTNFVGVIAIFIFFQQYGGWILVGIAEEKSSRIAEVLLAAVKPRQLVAGKILGIGAVGLGQALFVALSAIVTSRVVGSDILAGTQA
ncbi:MAG: ABC transporter permease, partial [Acidimicrobiales bacterium]|nr:ABC transporter permease [Acidimicrobiales bacterium]